MTSSTASSPVPIKPYDLVVVGGGPAGLATALTARSEGLSTLLLDCASNLGGQAGTSTWIRNYPGFAGGITGQALMDSMVTQADEFGVDFMLPVRANSIRRDGSLLCVEDDGSQAWWARSAVFAFGVQYRLLPLLNAGKFIGRGLTYGSPSVLDSYADQTLVVIGGANSAGQAAIHLSACHNCEVHLLVRGDSLDKRMSDYLVKEIGDTPNIHVRLGTEMTAVHGDHAGLNGIDVTREGTTSGMAADHVFVMIGAEPKTRWLEQSGIRLDRGYVPTGRMLPDKVRASYCRDLNRQPLGHETSMPGVFAVGDLVAGAPKRVATAVGAGAAAVQEIHEYLTTT